MCESKTRLVSGIIAKGNQVLLGFRQNTRDFAGYWSVPVGHVNTNESDANAIIRELNEELGIFVELAIPLKELIDEEQSIVHNVFKIETWNGAIRNNEPELCREVNWFGWDNLPKPITPITNVILNSYFL